MAFAFQHDARLLASGVMTIFDDGAGPPDVHEAVARTDAAPRHDPRDGVARHAGHSFAVANLSRYEGSDQLLGNGDNLVGFGSQPWITEFDSRGRTVFDARFVDANQSYRAYRYPWTGTPAAPPSVATRTSKGTTTVYASWNGSTQLARWQVLGGNSVTSLKLVASARKAAFETPIKLPHRSTYVAVRALDSHGHVLATSNAVKAS